MSHKNAVANESPSSMTWTVNVCLPGPSPKDQPQHLCTCFWESGFWGNRELCFPQRSFNEFNMTSNQEGRLQARLHCIAVWQIQCWNHHSKISPLTKDLARSSYKISPWDGPWLVTMVTRTEWCHTYTHYWYTCNPGVSREHYTCWGFFLASVFS